MGSYFTTQKEPDKILITGLDSTGKSMLLYKLKLYDIESLCPIVGWYIEKARYKKFELLVWESNGPKKIDPLKRHYSVGTVGVIYFVDANDRERIQESADGLERELRWVETSHEDSDATTVPLLIYANKSDLPDAMTKEEIVDKLGLCSMRSRAWYVQPSCLIDGTGIWEGLDWLEAQIKNGGYDVKAACHITSNKA